MHSLVQHSGLRGHTPPPPSFLMPRSGANIRPSQKSSPQHPALISHHAGGLWSWGGRGVADPVPAWLVVMERAGGEESLIFPASFFPCPSTKRTRIRRRARRQGVSAGGSPRARGRGDAASRGGGAAHGELAASPQPPFPQQAQAAAGARQLLGQAVPHPPRADGIAFSSCIPLCWGRGFSLPTTPPGGGVWGHPPASFGVRGLVVVVVVGGCLSARKWVGGEPSRQGRD